MCFNTGNNDCSCLWLIIIVVLLLCCCGNNCGEHQHSHGNCGCNDGCSCC